MAFHLATVLGTVYVSITQWLFISIRDKHQKNKHIVGQYFSSGHQVSLRVSGLHTRRTKCPLTNTKGTKTKEPVTWITVRKTVSVPFNMCNRKIFLMKFYVFKCTYMNESVLPFTGEITHLLYDLHRPIHSQTSGPLWFIIRCRVNIGYCYK